MFMSSSFLMRVSESIIMSCCKGINVSKFLINQKLHEGIKGYGEEWTLDRLLQKLGN